MKELVTKETKEIYEAICKSCGKKIQGSTKNEVVYNLAIHKDSKICKKVTFEQRVAKALPPRTKNYVSPLSAKEDSVSKEAKK